MITLPNYPTAFWICAVVAVLLIGISKAGFGVGLAAVATPLMAITIPAADAAALLLPLLIVSDWLTLSHYHSRFDKRNLKVLVPGSMVGIVLGWFFFGYFSHNERILKTGLGVLALAFVIFQLMRKIVFGLLEKRTPQPAEGVFWGTVSGFISTLAHAGGPPVMIHLLPQKMPRDRYVGTVAIYFAITNLVKLIPYGALGLIRIGNLYTILLLSPLAYIGVKLGIWLNTHFSERLFNAIVYMVLALTGMELVIGKSMIRLLF